MMVYFQRGWAKGPMPYRETMRKKKEDGGDEAFTSGTLFPSGSFLGHACSSLSVSLCFLPLTLTRSQKSPSYLLSRVLFVLPLG